MKAIRIESHGGLDKLLYKEIPLPSTGREDVLIRVRTCGLNHLDLFVREGKLPAPIQLPLTPGLEITGEVEKVGEDVKDFKHGDRVAALSRIGCGSCEYCEKEEENLCIRSRSLGITVDGGYAEYAVAPAKNLVRLPPNIDFLNASGASLSGLTAWHMLVSRAKLKPGEDVLVLAAGSSIGSFAIQIARVFGARVFATVGSEEKAKKALQLGATGVILYKEQSVSKTIKNLTGKRGVDVVFEHIGKETWEESLSCLARNGRMVTCGAHTGHEAGIDIWKLFSKQLSILGSYYGTKEELKELLNLMGEEKITTVIHRKFPLSDSREAQAVLEKRGNFGKVILEV